MKFRFKWFLPVALAAMVGAALCGCDASGEEHEHWVEAWKTVKAPTCTAEGAASGVCAGCGEEMNRVLDPIPHIYEKTVSEATCTTGGGVHYECACGARYDEGATPPTGHHYQKTVVKPTCDKEGYSRYSCDCGFSYVGEQTPATGHTLVRSLVAPTCETAGYTHYACVCGYEYSGDYVAPLGHTFVETVTAPTCEEEGFTRYTCACGFTYEGERVAATGHTFVETVTLPTCETVGYTHYACDCGYAFDGSYVAPTGHTFVETVTLPTCEEEGFTRYTCRCGYGYDGLFVVPTGHTLTETVVAATCVDDGYTHFDCEICDYEYDGRFVPALAEAHVSFTTEVVYPTVSRPEGYTRHFCPDCGYGYTENPTYYSEIMTGAYVDTTEIFRQGIDTSKWNHVGRGPDGELNPLDWEALKAAGVEFVILKAGSSVGLDEAFERDYRDAKAAGLEVGAYFYAYSSTAEDTLADAEMLITWLEGKQFELPIYYDMEDESLQDLGKETLTELCRVFMERLQKEGYYAALYVNNNWLYALMDTEWIKENLDVWFARYTADDYEVEDSHHTLADREIPWLDGTSSIPGEENKRYGMWQYTQIGRIEGFSTNFDFNFAYKDYKPIMEQWGLNGF